MSSLTPIVQLKDNQAFTNSRDVAEYFGKRHDTVLRKITNLLSDMSSEFNARNFAVVDYKDAKGEFRKSFDMTKKGFTMLAFGFTGKEAREFQLKYIEQFEAMEEVLKGENVELCLPDNPFEGIEFNHVFDEEKVPEGLYTLWELSSKHGDHIPSKCVGTVSMNLATFCDQNNLGAYYKTDLRFGKRRVFTEEAYLQFAPFIRMATRFYSMGQHH